MKEDLEEYLNSDIKITGIFSQDEQKRLIRSARGSRVRIERAIPNGVIIDDGQVLLTLTGEPVQLERIWDKAIRKADSVAQR